MTQHFFDHGMAHGPNGGASCIPRSWPRLSVPSGSARRNGMAIQFNDLTDKGAFVANPDGTFAVDMTTVKGGVRDLCHDLLTLEAQADHAAAKKILDTLGVVRPAMQRAIDALKSLPTDINPVNESAGGN